MGKPGNGGYSPHFAHASGVTICFIVVSVFTTHVLMCLSAGKCFAFNKSMRAILSLPTLTGVAGMPSPSLRRCAVSGRATRCCRSGSARASSAASMSGRWASGVGSEMRQVEAGCHIQTSVGMAVTRREANRRGI